MDETEQHTRFRQNGLIVESQTWPRVGTVGQPGMHIEVAHDPTVTNVVVTVLGDMNMAGCGLTPADARALADHLTTAAAQIEKRHGRQE